MSDEPADAAISAFDRLSAAEIKYVEAVLDGASHVSAWKAAHPRSKAKPTTIRTAAYQWHKRPAIQAAIAEAKKLAAYNAVQSREQWLADSVAREQEAAEAAQYSAVARLHENRGRALGFIQPSGSDPNQLPAIGGRLEPGEFVMAIRARLGDEAAVRAAKSFGIPLPQEQLQLVVVEE